MAADNDVYFVYIFNIIYVLEDPKKTLKLYVLGLLHTSFKMQPFWGEYIVNLCQLYQAMKFPGVEMANI